MWKEKGIECSTEAAIFTTHYQLELGVALMSGHDDGVLHTSTKYVPVQRLQGTWVGKKLMCAPKLGCHEHMEITLCHMECPPTAYTVNPRGKSGRLFPLERGSGMYE